MTISANSRYVNNTTSALTGADGVTRLTIMPRQSASANLTVTDYVWTSSDRVDLVAARAYGDETVWWLIANANPEILDWTTVPPGTIVRVPNGAAQ